jgi:hypothetical protein
LYADIKAPPNTRPRFERVTRFQRQEPSLFRGTRCSVSSDSYITAFSSRRFHRLQEGGIVINVTHVGSLRAKFWSCANWAKTSAATKMPLLHGVHKAAAFVTSPAPGHTDSAVPIEPTTPRGRPVISLFRAVLLGDASAS